ncbi:MAG: DUF4396 domain-containing protein [Marmoricola sp.]
MAESAHDHHHTGHDAMGSVNSMAVSATLHCLTGCAIGEIVGLIIGTAAGLGNAWTIVISIALAFVFGFTLSSMPLLRAGLALGAALSVVVAADTLSIVTMEIVDNVVMALIPGAMNAGLVNVLFWVGMMISLSVAFIAAVPVNRYLLQRGKGHALTHDYHGAEPRTDGIRRLIPAIPTSTLVAVLSAFMLGGLIVSIADDVGGAASAGTESGGHASPMTLQSMAAA